MMCILAEPLCITKLPPSATGKSKAAVSPALISPSRSPFASGRRRFAVQLHYADANCRPTACEDGVPAPNATYGPGGGFDCAPEAGGACVEPQYWFYRQAELIVAGKRVPGCI